MLKKVKFIYNPSSGGNIVAEYLDPIIGLYQSRGYSIIPYRLTFDRPAAEITEDLDGTFDHVLIAGGDGTVNYVVNGLKNAGIDIPVALLRTGTANDFANILGIPTDIMKASGMILDGRERRVDLGRVNGKWFVNVFSCGLFTDVSQKTPTLIKNNFGKIAYYMNGLAELPYFRKMNLEIRTDGGDYTGEAITFFVFNGRMAGQLPIAYLSEIDDGKLDVLVLTGDTTLETFRTALQLLARFSRREEYPKGIVHMRCSRLSAIAQRAEPTDMDGQPGPEFPIEITCEKGALRVIR